MAYRRQLNHLSPPPLPPPLTTTKHDTSLLHLHYTEFDDKNFQIKNQTLFYIFILFALTLLVSFLILYARWFFRFRRLPSPSSSSSSSSAPHAAASCAKGLDEAVIKAMPILLHQGSDVGERDVEVECCICLGVFEDGDKVKVLHECQHRFHSDCVDRWLSGQATCPLCRVSLRPLMSELELITEI